VEEAMSKTIIHVNQHVIRDNLKTGARNPVITVKTSKSNIYANGVDIKDAFNNVVARILYRPDNPLSCGARVWIETYNEVEPYLVVDVDDDETLAEILPAPEQAPGIPDHILPHTQKWEKWNEL
jgi:hypothetical protein